MTEGKGDGRVEGVCRGKGVMGGYECKLRKEGGEGFWGAVGCRSPVRPVTWGVRGAGASVVKGSQFG